MSTITLTKEENIFSLYSQLGNSGQKGDAACFIAKTFNVKVGTVRMHWLKNRELPEHAKMNEHKMDEVTTYLQNAIRLQNQQSPVTAK